MNFCPLKSKCKLSSLRSQCWMRHFLWFSNTVLWHSRRCYSILRHFIMIKLLLSVLANIDEGTQVRSWAPFIFKAFPWRIFNVSIMMHRQRAAKHSKWLRKRLLNCLKSNVFGPQNGVRLGIESHFCCWKAASGISGNFLENWLRADSLSLSLVTLLILDKVIW